MEVRSSVKAQKGRVKASLTRLEKYVNEIRVETITDEEQYCQLVAKAELLEPLLSKYESLCLTNAESEDIDEVDLDYDEFEERYVACKGSIKHLLLKYKCFDANKPMTTAVNEVGVRDSLPNIKLPELTLLKFSGNFQEWLQFKDTFIAIVCNNSSINDVAKFFYLNSSLTGEAKQLLANIPISEANFQVAWNLLCERYDNRRLIALDHTRKLFSPPPLIEDCPQSLRAVIDHFRSHVQALKALNLDVPLEEILLSQMLTSHLNISLMKEWENERDAESIPYFSDLIGFLERKCKVLELSHNNATSSDKTEVKHTNKVGNTKIEQNTKLVCACCRESHPLYYCDRFKRLSVSERSNLVRRARLCYKCLRSNTPQHTCSRYNCSQCNQPHHSLLHEERLQSSHNVASHVAQTRRRRTKKHLNCNNNTFNHCLLATARVRVNNSNNLTTLLDSGSDCHLITEHAVKRLRIPTYHVNANIQGITSQHSFTKRFVNLQVQSINGNWRNQLKCLVVHNITSHLPHVNIDTTQWNVPQDLRLADPKFNISKPIEMLLGADVFFDILLPEKIMPKCHDLPIIQNTKLGWIFAGNLPANINDFSRRNFNSALTVVVSKHQDQVICGGKRKQCQDQVICGEKRKQIACEEFPREKLIVDKVVRRIHEENQREMETKMIKKWKTKEEVKAFQKARELYNRWSHGYLHTLQQRNKWQTTKPNLKIGTLVLIKEDNLPPMQWRLGRVIQLHPGSDNLTRVVTLQTNFGTCKRPIHKLVCLFSD